MLKMIAGKVLGRLWEHTARKEGQELYAETIRECRQKNAGLLFDLHMRRSCIPQDCGRDAV